MAACNVGSRVEVFSKPESCCNASLICVWISAAVKLVGGVVDKVLTKSTASWISGVNAFVAAAWASSSAASALDATVSVLEDV